MFALGTFGHIIAMKIIMMPVLLVLVMTTTILANPHQPANTTGLVSLGGLSSECNEKDGWHPIDDGCFKFFDRTSGNSRAEWSCRREGRDVHLATITTPKQHDWIGQDTAQDGDVWIGLQHDLQSDEYFWLSDPQFQRKDWMIVSRRRTTTGGKVLNANGHTCVTMRPCHHATLGGNGCDYQGRPCSEKRPYVCSKPLIEPTTTTTSTSTTKNAKKKTTSTTTTTTTTMATTTTTTTTTSTTTMKTTTTTTTTT